MFGRLLLISAAAALALASALAAEPAPARGFNLFSNGGFELGLGAEPFYPGWRAPQDSSGRPSVPLPGEVPPRPVIDGSIAHGGKSSLKYSAIPGHGRAVLAFRSPLLPAGSETSFSIWARASRPGVTLSFGLCSKPGSFKPSSQLALSTDWKIFEVKLPEVEGFAQLRLEAFSSSAAPFDLWLDDVCWTFGGHSGMLRSGLVEGVLIPTPPSGLRLADKPLELLWSADAAKDMDVELNLSLCDLVRNGQTASVWSGKASLDKEPRQGRIPLQGVKRGSYIAELQFVDPASKAVLGVAKERFSLVSDLKGLPPPSDFDVGMHYGLGFGKDLYFNWRGYWSPDEFFANCFQTGFRVQRHIWSWESVEPKEGEFAFDGSAMDRLFEAALRNGCKSFPCIPGHPLNKDRAELKKLLASPEAADGSWIFRKGVDISSLSVRSNPMGFSQDPAQRKALFAPPPGALGSFMEAFAKRYRGKVVAIELTNEPNLYVKPEGLLDYYFKEAYPAVKKVAPELPVLMNQTMDFNADGNGYTGQFFGLGSFDYCDGFTHHPYGKNSLAEGGLEGVRILARLAAKYSRPDKKMVLGMSECHFIGQPFTRGQAVQRALLDWSIGCKWSAGFIIDGSFFLEAGPWNMFFNRSACVPGVGAAELNAFYAMLGGFKFQKRIELDDKILISAFEKSDAKAQGGRYAAALTCAELPLKYPVLALDLSGVDVSAFDCCGEPIALSSKESLRLGPETVYLKSDSQELFKRLQAARADWVQETSAVIECPNGQKDVETNESLLATGLPPKKLVSCGLLDSWLLLKSPANAVAGATPQSLGLIDGDGVLKGDPAKAIEIKADGQPYVFVDSAGKPGQGGYVYMAVNASKDEEQSFSLSSTGSAALWLNGKQAFEFKAKARQMQGASWQAFKLPLRQGVNRLLLRLEGSPCAFAMHAGERVPPPAVDQDGFIRKWAFIGPWENKRDESGKFAGGAAILPPEKSPGELPSAATLLQGRMGKRTLPLIWSVCEAKAPFVAHPWQEAVSYAFALVESPEDLDCAASFGADDGYALWVNGVELGRELGVSRGAKPDSDSRPVKLKKGLNSILFKIEDTGGGGGFYFRFLDAKGAPVPVKIQNSERQRIE